MISENLEFLGKFYGLHARLFVYCRYVLVAFVFLFSLVFVRDYLVHQNAYVTEGTVIDVTRAVSNVRSLKVFYSYKNQGGQELKGMAFVIRPYYERYGFKSFFGWQWSLQVGDKITVYINKIGMPYLYSELRDTFGALMASIVMLIIFPFVELLAKKEYEALLRAGWKPNL